MLVLSRKEGTRIRIGDHIVVEVVRIKGGYVRLGLTAPPDVHILRDDAIDCEPKEPKEGDCG